MAAKVVMDMIEWHWDRMNEDGDLNEDALMDTEIAIEGFVDDTEYDFSKLLGKKFINE